MSVPAQRLNHAARVTLVGSTNAVGPHGVVFPNSLVIENLRIQFKIEKQKKQHPNNCELVITNLNPYNRAFCQTDPLKVQVDAGYEDQLELVFSGDARYALSSLNGTDWETKLEFGDGEAVYNDAQLVRSYGPGTATGTIVKDAAGQMGLKIPTNIAGAKELFTQVVSGASYNAPAATVLTEVLTPLEIAWSIQNGVLQMLREKESLPDEAILISKDTGMVGTPELGKPPKKGGPSPIKINVRLTPRIKYGALLRVEARNLRGTYRVEKLVHTGDTHGDTWSTEIEALPV